MILSLLLFHLAASAWAQPADLTVTWLGPERGAVAEVLADTDAILQELHDATGLRFTGKLSVVIAVSEQDFQSYLSRFGDGALNDALGVYVPPSLADPDGRVPSIALNLERHASQRLPLRATYKHELCHALLDATIARALRPLWFEEGMAQWVSETAIEHAMQDGTGTRITPRSVQHISAMIRTQGQQASGYAHALAALHSLESRFGEDGIRTLLGAMAKHPRDASLVSFAQVYGEAFPTASITYTEWERQFLDSLEFTLFGDMWHFVGANLFGLSMGLAAALLVIGVLMRRRRDRALLEHWREVDRAFPPDPDALFAESDDVPLPHAPLRPQVFRDPPPARPVQPRHSEPVDLSGLDGVESLEELDELLEESWQAGEADDDEFDNGDDGDRGDDDRGGVSAG